MVVRVGSHTTLCSLALLAAAACLLVLRGATAFKELHHVEKSLKSEPSLIVGYDDARIRLMKYKKISRIDQDIITKLLSSNETTTATKAPTARLFSLKSKYTKEGQSQIRAANYQSIVLKATRALVKTLKTSSSSKGSSSSTVGYDFLENLKIPAPFCPVPPQTINQCEALYPYRTYDGSCNNLNQPWWGMKNSPYKRLIRACYDDDLEKYKSKSVVNGQLLPSARAISQLIHREYPSKAVWNNFLVYFAQMVAADMARTPFATDDDGAPIKCNCEQPATTECQTYTVGHNDTKYCFPFVRSMASVVDFSCNVGQRQQLNQNTHWLDLNIIYSSDAPRTSTCGQFVTSQLPNGETVFPFADGCACPLSTTVPIFKTPDPQAEQNTMSTSLHTLMLRSHNSIAAILCELNKDWSDEHVFQEARRVNIAIYQHIVYKEMLPLVVGSDLMIKYGLAPLKEGFFYEYDSGLYPPVSVEFATAAFRMHTLVNHQQCIGDRSTKTKECSYLDDWWETTKFTCNSINRVLSGMISVCDYYMTPQVNWYMNNMLLGIKDLSIAVLNIMRGRDHGLPGYNTFRKLVGLPVAKTFADLSNIPRKVRDQMKSLYSNVNDIDLWTAGVSELPLRDAMLGPTHATIVAKQFSDSKKGDRFYYENGEDDLTRFTIEQLTAIRRVNLAFLLCLNTDFRAVPKLPFLMVNDKTNPLIYCEDLKEAQRSFLECFKE